MDNNPDGNEENQLLSSIIKENFPKSNNKYQRKNINHKTIILTNSESKKKILSQQRRRSEIISLKNSKKKKIEKKKLSHCPSDGELYAKSEKNDSNQINIIKLQDSDLDKIVNFVNEEEKRRIKTEKNLIRLERENIEKKEEDIIYNIFKEKNEEENIDKDELTREDIIKKLKKNDWRVREYVEGIIKAGLTIGDKKLNNKMKNQSILVYKDYNLGNFKFKKNRNFGIIDDIDLEPIRPLSNRVKKNDEKNENKNENNDDKNKKKRKKVKMGSIEREEPKKELIYDNTYLFSKNNKKSVNFILRKEVEEILEGGILLQMKAYEAQQVMLNFRKKKKDNNTKNEYVKKKGKIYKLFRKSIFLSDLIDKENFRKQRQEEARLKEIQKREDIKEKNLDTKIKIFLDKINRLKAEGVTHGSGAEEIDDYITQLYKLNHVDKDRENRIKEFVMNLDDYRYARKKQRELKDTFTYKKPILVENIMVENYEDIISHNRNINNIKNNKTEGELDKIMSNKNHEKFGYKEDKSYLTQINY